ncbi:MAG: tRNA-dihydrouridine synthase [Thermoguttaceae bacterium]|nr:tRNA-dihydrouridine synthase [Thermoguttaceae bacterium]MBP3695045.1 tRNA-dihydrouridine synthase [Thermoguttaceae bacterium]
MNYDSTISPNFARRDFRTDFHFPDLSIGSVPIGFPCIQAALSGVSDWAERQIARRLGASATVSEVMLDEFIISVTHAKGKKAKRFLRVEDSDHPVGAQLMGVGPEDFTQAALKVVEWGFDWVDINFGCPVKKILGRHRGGFHLSQPEMALSIVRSVRDTVPAEIPVSIKMRRGLDDSAESLEKFYEIFDGARALGISVFTVHPRTVLQRYVGTSDWKFLADLRKYAPDAVILGSGDLFSAEDCVRMMETTGVNGVTVARGAIGNPWIFRDLRELAAGRELPPLPTLSEQREVIEEHFALACELYGEKRAVFNMKKFSIKYAQIHPEHTKVRDDFVKFRTLGELRAILDRWYT